MGLEEYAPIVRIVDETKEIVEVFENIKERLQPWEVMFQQLVEFKKAYGHCDIHAHYLENKQLGIWVSTQRYAKKKETISEERVRRLNEIDFVWNLIDEFWEENFAALLEYRKVRGHCKVPKRFFENPQLGTWAQHQRQNRRLGKLSKERIKRLDEVDFFWGIAKKAKIITWEEHFTALIDYKNRYGNCKVPTGWAENPRLAGWVKKQRQAYKKGTLCQEYVIRLNAIDFDWNPLATSWEKKYAMLIEYKNTYENCNVPQGWIENKELATWVAGQRKAKQRGTLSEEYIERLNKIGFVWDALSSSWNEMYEALIEYKRIRGNCRVPVRYKENPKLAQWVGTQRKAKTAGTISKERIEKLNAIGFVWEPFTNSWEENYAMLVEFVNKYGHCDVPLDWAENRQLSTWFFHQRKRKNVGKLSRERIEKLDKLGFEWNPLETYWDEMYENLKKYKKMYGNCHVPSDWFENPQLGIWVSGQRSAKKRDKLSQERIDKLNQIEFVWDLLEDAWDENFAELVQYKNMYDDCNVPSKWDKNPTLGIWVQHQRHNNKKGKISKEHIERLNQLGFMWELLDTAWEEMFLALIKYKKENGDCNVPQRDVNNKRLGRWVRTQRKAKQDGKLSQERIQRLETLGFIWDTLETSWEQMFKSLVQYKNKHRHCNVPNPNSENLQLGVWVNTQRLTKRKGELSEERVEQLNKIEFVWEPSQAYWEKMFEALLEYKNIYGHCKVPDKYSQIPRLNSWVRTQRKLKKDGKLKPEYIERLNKIEFVWNPHEEFWEQMFKMLIEYKNKHGHCKVPNRYSENKQLGSWVGFQRKAKKDGKLSEERIQRLEDIGFVWNSKENEQK
ncbi:helicase domain protein [Beggiatoa sp. PS]|nr:helicase domain protein [Beggiatoa sp. PS]